MTPLLLDPGTFQVAAPELQSTVGGDPSAARRFPPGARIAAITPAMGLFELTDEQLTTVIQRATAGLRGSVPRRISA